MRTHKILFASIALDGHFNPLTGLATHLQETGYDVRWYTGGTFSGKLAALGIPHYPFRKALEVTQENMDEVFPQRKTLKSQIAKMKFDLKNYFVLRTPEFFADIEDIFREFPFDLIVTDCCFPASIVVKEKLGVPLVNVGIIPLMETSRDLAPAGLALLPAGGFWGRRKQDVLRWVAENFLFREAGQVYNGILRELGVAPVEGIFFNALIRRADVFLQSGTPGFEYARTDVSPNVRFVGPLLPYRPAGSGKPLAFAQKLKTYRQVVLVTQGTVERDPEKILVPTLEAFKDTDTLVVATTGGSGTQALRERFPQANLVIEDFVDFNAIMPHAHAYVTNAGFGGVLMSIGHRLPMVAAGVHEGKNEIAARIGYFHLGVNLNTETPTPAQIREGVAEVLRNPTYRQHVAVLADEFCRYQPQQFCAQYVAQLLAARHPAPAKGATEGVKPAVMAL
ncbi:MAG TPA: glycosyltransferase [Cytophagales bacterium]|jgi:MGT family glycosyltransferase